MFSEKYLDFRAAIGEFVSVNEPYTNLVFGSMGFHFKSLEKVYISSYDKYIRFDINSEVAMLIYDDLVSFCLKEHINNEDRVEDVDKIAEFKINNNSIHVLTVSGLEILISL